MTLQGLAIYLEEDLENRKAGGEDCPECAGRGKLVYLDAEPLCEYCEGSGKSPAITQAEEALKAAREAANGLLVPKISDEDICRLGLEWLAPHGPPSASDWQGLRIHEWLNAVIGCVRVPKPVSNSAESGVSNEESEG